jgi:hypothetical protein
MQSILGSNIVDRMLIAPGITELCGRFFHIRPLNEAEQKLKKTISISLAHAADLGPIEADQ